MNDNSTMLTIPWPIAEAMLNNRSKEASKEVRQFYIHLEDEWQLQGCATTRRGPLIVVREGILAATLLSTAAHYAETASDPILKRAGRILRARLRSAFEGSL